MKIELKIWIIYFATILLSTFVHELGHCIPAWLSGYSAIPTPAKEYISKAVPLDILKYISLGGVIGSMLFSLVAIFLYIKKASTINASILAAAIAIPGAYTLRFILMGRGHDATEFQEAQSALGFSYYGNSLDWFFLVLFVSGVLVWIIKSRPHYKIFGRLLIGSVLTVIFVIGLQGINNAIFDSIFKSQL